MRNPIKFLILGAGSIGRRHAINAAQLGVEISIFDTNLENLTIFCKKNGFSPIFDLSKALLENNYSAALICTPNNTHIFYAQQMIEANLDVFIEKPLSHSYDDVENLISIVNNKNLIGMAGFNIRFEPGLQHLKKILNHQNVAFVQIESGSHMPTWREGVDYRKTYSANKAMGGGIILDDVHELDYACWLFGYPDSIISAFGRFSNFEIDVEDTAVIVYKYPDKLLTIHSDYLQKNYARRCKICYRDGNTITWTYGDQVVQYTDGKEQLFNYKDSFDSNSMYIDEMKHFLECITTRKKPESGLENAAKILSIALTAKEY